MQNHGSLKDESGLSSIDENTALKNCQELLPELKSEQDKAKVWLENFFGEKWWFCWWRFSENTAGSLSYSRHQVASPQAGDVPPIVCAIKISSKQNNKPFLPSLLYQSSLASLPLKSLSLPGRAFPMFPLQSQLPTKFFPLLFFYQNTSKVNKLRNRLSEINHSVKSTRLFCRSIETTMIPRPGRISKCIFARLQPYSSKKVWAAMTFAKSPPSRGKTGKGCSSHTIIPLTGMNS